MFKGPRILSFSNYDDTQVILGAMQMPGGPKQCPDIVGFTQPPGISHQEFLSNLLL